jgi:para-nitrobenzyl esterase
VPPFQQKRRAGRITEPALGGFGPVVDGVVLPQHPFDPAAPVISRHKPLITGWNEDEYTFFAWERGDVSAFKLDLPGLQAKLAAEFGEDGQQIFATHRKTMPDASAADLYVAIASMTMMGLGTVEIAESKAAQQGAPVYLYYFGYKSEMKIPGTDYAIGTPHAMDITFKFNNETPENGPGFLSGNRPDRFIASRKMAELWTTFARTGKPAATAVPVWPAYTLDARSAMRIDTECEVVNNRFREELAMWRAKGW